MGICNTLRHSMRCPRCESDSEMRVDLYFGAKDLIEYKIGDRIRWNGTKAVKNGGRPEGGNLDGEGYAECPVCQKDFYVIARVRNDELVGVEPDPSKRSHILD